MYLIDTDILSELRKRRADANVVGWFDTIASTALFLSRITIFEIEFGIEQRQRDNPTFSNDLALWLEAVLRLYGERILPLTTNVARRWGRISAQVGNKNLDLG